MLPCCSAIWPWMLRHNTTSSSDAQTGGVEHWREQGFHSKGPQEEEQASRRLIKFNKGKWGCALGSAVLHVPGQAEGWANSPIAGVWASHTNSCSQPGETPGKGCWGHKGTTAPEVQREAGATALLRLEARRPRQEVATIFHYLIPLEETDTDISQGCAAKEQKATVTSCSKGKPNWIQGKFL